jgi:hypothetical protein
MTAEVRPDAGKAGRSSVWAQSNGSFEASCSCERDFPLPKRPEGAIMAPNSSGIWGMSANAELFHALNGRIPEQQPVPGGLIERRASIEKKTI